MSNLVNGTSDVFSPLAILSQILPIDRGSNDVESLFLDHSNRLNLRTQEVLVCD
jgi:hypothetical protein